MAITARCPYRRVWRRRRNYSIRLRRHWNKAQTEERSGRGNLTDPDAVLMGGRTGLLAGYNAQAMGSSIKAEYARGMLIAAAEVTPAAHDHGQWLPMIDRTCENTGVASRTTLADGGYHSGESLSRCDATGYHVLRPESQRKAL